MKIKLLIASPDIDYVEHLSNVLSEKHSDTFDISVCSSTEHLSNMLNSNKFDVALIEPIFVSTINADSVRLLLMLMDESSNTEDYSGAKRIRKYQRISSIAGNVLENYAEVSTGVNSFDSSKARITAVWSPSGGSGKTTVALAFAANSVLSGKSVVYLNLECFSSTSVYFKNSGRSISKAFEKLESNVHLFLAGIRQQDSSSGISYFCEPENYDDMNILSKEDIETIVGACATGVDELIVDLSSQCDERVQKIFEIANTVLLVCESSGTSQIKLKQFLSQHNVFGQINSKVVLVNNKGAKTTDASISKVIHLPLLQSNDPVSTYKTLSGGNFDW